jgi:hypothetical protein
MYADINYKTKRELIAAVKEGKQIGVYSPGGFFPAPTTGRVTIEGPHYPRPHTWYASAEIRDGIIIKVK